MYPETKKEIVIDSFFGQARLGLGRYLSMISFSCIMKVLFPHWDLLLRHFPQQCGYAIFPNPLCLVVVAKVIEGENNFGYDAKTNTYGNMQEKGIIDPKKVTRIALENAAS